LKECYRAGRVGDVEVKRKLAAALNRFLDPIRERRAQFDIPGLVEEIIVQGTQIVREETKKTPHEMRMAMGFTRVWNHLEAEAGKRK